MYLQAGKSQKEIAELLAKSPSVISREIKRNELLSGKYKAACAEDFYRYRRQRSRKKKKLENQKIKTFVEEQLKQDKSPEQIAGVMGRDAMPDRVSHETIYQYVWQDKRKGGQLHKHLRNRGRKYAKRGSAKHSRGTIAGRVPIDQRPEVVNQRTRVGDLEIDLVLGKNHKGAILTIVERKSGIAWLRKLNGKSAEDVQQQLTEALHPIKSHIHTITSDNGKEFTGHLYIAKQLGIEYYFAHPYHSWERGSNENFNRLLRQYFPKNMDLSAISNKELLEVQNKLNQRERKRLNYLSPIQYLRSISLTKVAFAT